MKKALLLLSDGIDSPVAGYLMKKQNVELLGIHMDNRPLTDDRPIEKVKKIAKIIGINKLYVIPHGPNQVQFIKNCDRKFGCVLCRRMMYRLAEEIAKKEGCDFIVSGENLGQVASQTIPNLATEQSVITIPILRPLLCFDKQETINIAKEIGTYEISIEKSICCSAVPKNPATRSKKEVLEHEEKKIDIDGLIKDSIKNAEIVNIS